MASNISPLSRGYHSRIGFNLRPFGVFSSSSYSTFQKVNVISKRTLEYSSIYSVPRMEKLEKPITQKSHIPSSKEVEKNPILRKEIIQGYEELADDPDFQDTTQYVMSMAMKDLKKTTGQ